MGWVAYADESIRGRPDGTGAYIMAAACLEAASCEATRPVVARLVRPGRRFHWRDADDRQRDGAVTLVAGLPALHIIVVGTPLDPPRQERARRHCLARLLYELERADVEHTYGSNPALRH